MAGEHRLPFQVRDGLIYIRAQVNGSRATLLVDTGAAFTTFTVKLVPTLDTDSRITLNLAKGSVSAFRLPIGFALGDSDLQERRRSFRLNAVVGDFKFLNADGLIGQDVLSQFKSVTFDFKNSTLVLEDH
jgi:predicted aspartyl protease